MYKKKNRYKYIDYQEKDHFTLEKLKPDVMICRNKSIFFDAQDSLQIEGKNNQHKLPKS